MAGRWGVIAAILLIGLAGCSGYLADLDGSSPTPSPTPAETDHVAAPGVTTEGVTDPGQVARAHAATFRNRSYTRRAVTTIKTSRGETAQATQVLKAGPDGNRLQITNYSDFSDVAYGSDGSPPFRQESIWWNGNTSYIVQYGHVESDVAYGRYNRDTIARIVPRVERNIEILTLFNNTNVSEITYNGWVAYRIEAAEGQETTTLRDDIRVTATIDAFGRLHNLYIQSFSDDFFLLHDGFAVTISITYTAIGNTTLTRPDWVEIAKNKTANDSGKQSNSSSRNSN